MMKRSWATGGAALIVIALGAHAGLTPSRVAAQDVPKELPVTGVADSPTAVRLRSTSTL